MIMKNRDKHNPKPEIKFCLTVDGKTLPYQTKEEFLLAVWERLTEMKERNNTNTETKAHCA